MAIIDRPLYGDEARGRIKGTLVFIKRTANLGYDGEDPGERFIINHLNAYRQTHGVKREEWKEIYRAACEQWAGLSEGEKAAYWAYVDGLQTNFNVFLREVIGGEQIMPQPFDGPVMIRIMGDVLNFTGVGGEKSEDLIIKSDTWDLGTKGNPTETIAFTYTIP